MDRILVKKKMAEGKNQIGGTKKCGKQWVIHSFSRIFFVTSKKNRIFCSWGEKCTVNDSSESRWWNNLILSLSLSAFCRNNRIDKCNESSKTDVFSVGTFWHLTITQPHLALDLHLFGVVLEDSGVVAFRKHVPGEHVAQAGLADATVPDHNYFNVLHLSN